MNDYSYQTKFLINLQKKNIWTVIWFVHTFGQLDPKYVINFRPKQAPIQMNDGNNFWSIIVPPVGNVLSSCLVFCWQNSWFLTWCIMEIDAKSLPTAGKHSQAKVH